MPVALRRECLQRMRQLADLLGNPHERLSIVHVAGTKGKGSTATMICEALRAAGYRTGLFMSPHLVQLEERITVDGRPIATDTMTALIDEIRPAVEHIDRMVPNQRGPTFFEITTAAGFLHFAREQVDVAVIEVGLGGRLDSTNICLPRCSVITNISRDHMKQLGETEQKIAREKAGIIKPGVPIVSGATHPGAVRVIAEVAQQQSAPRVQCGEHYEVDVLPAVMGTDVATDRSVPYSGSIPDGFAGPETVFHYREMRESVRRFDQLRVSMTGNHQAMNAGVATATLCQLQHGFPRIDEPAIRAGLLSARLAARIEVLHRNPVVILDGAHNEMSIHALFDTIEQHWPHHRKCILFGTTRGKDIVAMLRRIVRSAHRMVATQYVENPRAVDPDEIQQLVHSLSSAAVPVPTQVIRNPREAWAHVWHQAAADHVICVTGSLFLAGELRGQMMRDLRASFEPTYADPSSSV